MALSQTEETYQIFKLLHLMKISSVSYFSMATHLKKLEEYEGNCICQRLPEVGLNLVLYTTATALSIMQLQTHRHCFFQTWWGETDG